VEIKNQPLTSGLGFWVRTSTRINVVNPVFHYKEGKGVELKYLRRKAARVTRPRKIDTTG